MNSIEQVERLIQRLPMIACTTNSPAAFWQRVDGAMEIVRVGAKSEAERKEIEIRYTDLIEMANRLGMPCLDPDLPHGAHRGRPPPLAPMLANHHN